jgi:transcriptional regulator with XRE-family HTH domain
MAGLAARSFALMGLHIGDLVVQRMERLGMTQTKLAERTGIPRRTIIRWLNEPIWSTDAIESVSTVLEFNLFEKLAEDYASRHGLRNNVVGEPQAEYGRRTIKLTVEMDDDPDNRRRVEDLTSRISGSPSVSNLERESAPDKKKK